MPNYPDTPFVTLAPDWVCEVLSPSTRRLDLRGKRPIYAREGVPHLWFLDSGARTLEAFEPHDGRWLLIATVHDDDLVSVRPFEAVELDLDALWP